MCFKSYKAFWNSNLTEASNELQFLRKKFEYKTNIENGQKLKAAKERFKILLNKSVTEWMEIYLSSLGQKRKIILDFLQGLSQHQT